MVTFANTSHLNNMENVTLRFSVVAGLMVALLSSNGSAEDADRQWQDPIIIIGRSDCAALVEHQADASVEYQPGIDATGRTVAPADLPGHEPLELGAEDVSLDLRIPLSRYYDIPVALQSIIGDAEIDAGRVTVRGGVAYLGDHRLDGQASNAIARACAENR